MISAWELYLWTRLESVASLSKIVAIVLCVIPVCIYVFSLVRIAYGSDWEDYTEGSVYAVRCKFALDQGKKLIKSKLPLFIIGTAFTFSVITVAIPSKKDAAMIWIVPQLATVENAELLKGEVAEIYKLAKDALKESIGTETVTE